jgi:hypothetical protein
MIHMVFLGILSLSSSGDGWLPLDLALRFSTEHLGACAAGERSEIGSTTLPSGNDAQLDELPISSDDQADDEAGEDGSDGLVTLPLAIETDRSLILIPSRAASRLPWVHFCRCLPLLC